MQYFKTSSKLPCASVALQTSKKLEVICPGSIRRSWSNFFLRNRTLAYVACLGLEQNCKHLCIDLCWPYGGLSILKVFRLG